MFSHDVVCLWWLSPVCPAAGSVGRMIPVKRSFWRTAQTAALVVTRACQTVNAGDDKREQNDLCLEIIFLALCCIAISLLNHMTNALQLDEYRRNTNMIQRRSIKSKIYIKQNRTVFDNKVFLLKSSWCTGCWVDEGVATETWKLPLLGNDSPPPPPGTNPLTDLYCKGLSCAQLRCIGYFYPRGAMRLRDKVTVCRTLSRNYT